MFKGVQMNFPTKRQPTMDPKFIFVLFFVEVGSLIFHILHMSAKEIHVYNAYNQLPVIYDISSEPYSCFSTINYCVYEQKQLHFLKLLDLIFISIILICYGFLFTIIVQKWENIKIRLNLRITWYTALQFLVLLTLALHALLMIILFERDTENTSQCNKQNRLVRLENIFDYFVLCILEVTYIGFNLINRQVLSSHIPQQEFQYESQPAEQLRFPPLESGYRVNRT